MTKETLREAVNLQREIGAMEDYVNEITALMAGNQKVRIIDRDMMRFSLPVSAEDVAPLLESIKAKAQQELDALRKKFEEM
jgi:hypothetical protein